MAEPFRLEAFAPFTTLGPYKSLASSQLSYYQPRAYDYQKRTSVEITPKLQQTKKLVTRNDGGIIVKTPRRGYTSNNSSVPAYAATAHGSRVTSVDSEHFHTLPVRPSTINGAHGRRNINRDLLKE